MSYKLWDLTQEFQLRQLFCSYVWRIQCSKRLTTELAKEGVMAGATVFPMVARDKARIRTQMSADLLRTIWMSLLRIFERVGPKLGLV